MPHAETHTILLPHSLSYNAPEIGDTMEQLAQVLPDSNGDAVRGLNMLLDRLHVQRALKDFGLREEDIGRAAEIAVGNANWNPRAVEKKAVEELIRRAWAGEKARADL